MKNNLEEMFPNDSVRISQKDNAVEITSRSMAPVRVQNKIEKEFSESGLIMKIVDDFIGQNAVVGKDFCVEIEGNNVVLYPLRE
jgi:ribosome-interacting GTPase 1